MRPTPVSKYGGSEPGKSDPGELFLKCGKPNREPREGDVFEVKQPPHLLPLPLLSRYSPKYRAVLYVCPNFRQNTLVMLYARYAAEQYLIHFDFFFVRSSSSFFSIQTEVFTDRDIYL